MGNETANARKGNGQRVKCRRRLVWPGSVSANCLSRSGSQGKDRKRSVKSENENRNENRNEIEIENGNENGNESRWSESVLRESAAKDTDSRKRISRGLPRRG